MLHFFIVEIGLKVSQLLPSSIILEIFSKHLSPREQQKVTLTRFNLENILSSLVLETETVNNSLVNNVTPLQPLLLGAVKFLLRVTRYETLVRETVFFAYSNILYNCSKRSGIDTFSPASFNETRNCLHWKNWIILYSIFFLFADDDGKMNQLKSYLGIKASVKNSTLVTVIYLFERTY